MAPLAEQELDGSERRIAPRMRVLKRAKIIFNNGFSTFDCVVRNVSATGALLTLAEAAHMPKEFQIKIGEDKVRPARLVYRRTMFAGIRFADIPDEDEDEKRANPAPPAAAATAQTPQAPSIAGDAPAPIASGIAKIRPQVFPKAVVRNMPWQS
ncbi:PilZ domain-containing protein [Fulvimarina sp. MAC8]|uniref:PilZ domain-containing protein n=1 Tax=Fulvimarina sp. MAC8 TaxID=3162874 RepID=UPI0032EEDDFC